MRTPRLLIACLAGVAATGCGRERLAGEIPCDEDAQCPGGFHCEPCAQACAPRAGRCAAGERGPRVEWLSPEPLANPASIGRNVHLEVLASDPDGVTAVVFSVGGREVGRVSAAPWALNADLSGFEEGAAELAAEATDARGLAVRAARGAVVDLAPPPLAAERVRLEVDAHGTKLVSDAEATEAGAALLALSSEAGPLLAVCTPGVPCALSDAGLRDAWVQARDAAGNASEVLRVPEVRVVFEARPPGALGARAIGTARRPAPASFGGEELLAAELALVEDADALKLTAAASAVAVDTPAAWIYFGAGGPVERCSPLLAWHAGQKRVVMHGGAYAPCPAQGAAVLTDTWAWDGAAPGWTRLGGGFPAERSGGAIAAVPGGVLLHGGWREGVLQELFLLGGGWWTALAAGPAREHGCLAADAGTAGGRDALQFGGLDPTGPSGETWSYRETSGWTQRFPAGSTPAPRSRHGCVRDEARGVVVLHGGFDGALSLADTWEWSGTAWSLAAGAPPPAENQQATLAYDDVRSRVLLVGAGDYGSAVWEWSGSAWRATPMSAAGPEPSPRERFGAAYDAERGRLVVYGGITPSGAALGETWELAWERWPRVLLSFAVGDADAARLQTLALQSDAPRALFWTGASWSQDAADAHREDGRFSVLLEPAAPALRTSSTLTADRVALVLVLGPPP
jgi:hypothetical protein